jgi:hypothetical protein
VLRPPRRGFCAPWLNAPPFPCCDQAKGANFRPAYSLTKKVAKDGSLLQARPRPRPRSAARGGVVSRPPPRVLTGPPRQSKDAPGLENTAASYKRYMQRQLVADLKETVCRACPPPLVLSGHGASLTPY